MSGKLKCLKHCDIYAKEVENVFIAMKCVDVTVRRSTLDTSNDL